MHGKAGVIYRPDGTSSAFMGSLNETREGWSANYEFVWEDTSADGVAWVEGHHGHAPARLVVLKTSRFQAGEADGIAQACDRAAKS